MPVPIDILIVEDEPAIVEMLVDIFTDMGVSTCVAYHGAQALHVLQEYLPALILLDLTMPVMDGYTLLQHLHAHGYAGLPVIVMSASPSVERVHMLGVTNILPKPFELDHLLYYVGQYIPFS